jgi:acetyl esterase/lipase
MTNLSYDKEFAEAIKSLPGIQIPALASAAQTREVINSFTSAAVQGIPDLEGVTETKLQVSAGDGTVLELLCFEPTRPADAAEASGNPCIALLHGGGLIALSTDIFRPIYKITAAMTGRTVFGVPYRLAPEFSYPTPLEDVCASIKYISSHAKELGIDPKRIGIFGQSAGACLAVAAALKLRDEHFQPPLAKLILQQPLLDDRTYLPPDHPKHKLLVWSQELNDMSWKAYLGKDREQREAGVPQYASPGRVEALSGLPPVFIDVGSLDLYASEVVEFTSKLLASDVQVELHLYGGVPHAFDGIAAGISKSKDITEKRMLALGDF